MMKKPVKEEEARIVEALLFSSPDVLTQSKVDVCFDGGVAPSLEEIVPKLRAEYDEGARSFTVERVAGGYRLVSRSEYEPWIRRLYTRAGKVPLSRAALETLAVVAYKSSVSRAEIESIRGVNSAGVLQTLMEKKLVKIHGRGKGPGRPLLYKVTDAFMVSFGLDKLSDLPKLRELSELMSESAAAEADNEAE